MAEIKNDELIIRLPGADAEMLTNLQKAMILSLEVVATYGQGHAGYEQAIYYLSDLAMQCLVTEKQMNV